MKWGFSVRLCQPIVKALGLSIISLWQGVSSNQALVRIYILYISVANSRFEMVLVSLINYAYKYYFLKCINSVRTVTRGILFFFKDMNLFFSFYFDVFFQLLFIN